MFKSIFVKFITSSTLCKKEPKKQTLMYRRNNINQLWSSCEGCTPQLLLYAACSCDAASLHLCTAVEYSLTNYSCDVHLYQLQCS